MAPVEVRGTDPMHSVESVRDELCEAGLAVGLRIRADAIWTTAIGTGIGTIASRRLQTESSRSQDAERRERADRGRNPEVWQPGPA